MQLAAGSWRKTRSGPCPRQARRAGRRPPLPGWWRHSSSRPPPPQRAEGLRLGLQQFHLHGQLSELHGQFRLHRSPLRCLSEASIPRSLSHATLERSLRPTGAMKHRLVTQKPQNDPRFAPPFRWQSASGPAGAGLGKTWTSQRPHLPQVPCQQQLSSGIGHVPVLLGPSIKPIRAQEIGSDSSHLTLELNSHRMLAASAVLRVST